MIACMTCGKLHLKRESKNRDGTACKNSFCSRACYLVKHQEKVSVTCLQCGIVNLLKKSDSKKKFCSYECCRKYRELSVVARNCLGCGKSFIPIMTRRDGSTVRMNARKTCSRECSLAWIRNNPERKRKISVAFKGSNHPNWQGGKSYFRDMSSRGPNWVTQSQMARKRDGYKCCVCGITEAETGREMDVHHKIPFHNFATHKTANRLANLESMCHSCHMVKEHSIDLGKQMILPIFNNQRGHRGHSRGEDRYCAKLKRIDVLRLRSLAAVGPVNYSALAREYGVTHNTVRSAISGATWKSA